jgi:hypothetical protein
MTPLHWQMLLHYYAIAEPYASGHPGHANSLVVKAYTADLLESELIRPDPTSGSGYRATDRGEALVDHITNLPLPEKVWVMPAATDNERSRP